MATGIEHRSIDTIMDAYNNGGLPNFSIWAGPQLRIKYEGGNVDEGYSTLNNYLNVIKNANTHTVYTLKLYPAETQKINNKTDYDGSTSFMLRDDIPVRADQNGVTVIDRTINGSNNNNQGLQMFLEKMMTQQQLMFDKMMQIQANQQQTKLDKFIGMVEENWNKQQLEPVKDVFDKIGDMMEKNPTVVKDIFSGINGLVATIIPGKGPVQVAGQVQQPGQIAGTTKHSQQDPAAETNNEDIFLQHTMQTHMPQQQQENTAGAAEERELTDEELDALDARTDAAIEKLDSFCGSEGTVQLLEQLSSGDEAGFIIWVAQQNALAQLNSKLGPQKLLTALQALAAMSDMKLKGLLAMM